MANIFTEILSAIFNSNSNTPEKKAEKFALREDKAKQALIKKGFVEGKDFTVETIHELSNGKGDD